VTRRFKPPIYTKSQRGVTTWVLNIGDDERAIIRQLLDELRSLLSDAGEIDSGSSEVLHRLFPTAYPDDEAKEAEYQRLMREDLVTSRIVQIDTVTEALGRNGPLEQGDVVALMQSVNAVRVVLGTMLDVGEDDDIGAGGDESEPERQLYGYLSWLLDWIVRSLQS
jgi:hypothetical protein